MTVRSGTVYLVGAGPGDPGLISVRGLELLQRADVVLHDRLVSDALLSETSPRAELVNVGKGPTGDSGKQSGIHAMMIRHARAGRVVVRLKGGDPFVFGRGWEELQACRQAGIPCEAIPGISSALAAPLAADIPLTLRGRAASFTVETARRSSGGAPEAGHSRVVLMGIAELPSVTTRLLDEGVDPGTPAAVIERATWPGQRVVRAPLDRIAALAAEARIEPPAVLVVGPGAESRDTRLFPLAGRRVLVTRPLSASGELVRRLRAAGAEVLTIPLIAIEPVRELPDDGRERLRAADWIAVTSRHGARGLWRLLVTQGDLRDIGSARVAAIGPGTARELERWGIRADITARPERAEVLAAEMLLHPTPPRRVLFACGTLALRSFPAALREAGVTVDPLTVYRTRPLVPGDRERHLLSRGVDAITLASPSAVQALARAAIVDLDTPVVCIGPTTGTAARDAGFRSIRIARSHTDAGMVESLLPIVGPQVVCS